MTLTSTTLSALICEITNVDIPQTVWGSVRMSDTVISIHDTSAGAFAFVFDYVLEMRYVVLGGQC